MYESQRQPNSPKNVFVLKWEYDISYQTTADDQGQRKYPTKFV